MLNLERFFGNIAISAELIYTNYQIKNTEKPPAMKILFVCLGNICRSPAAEAILNQYLSEAKLSDQVTCDSAGTSAGHTGQPSDERMQAAAKSLGYTIQHKARQITDFDLVEFDLIIAMDKNNYFDIRQMAHDEAQQKKIHMMCSFCSHHSVTEVPDPYYRGNDGFTGVIALLEDGCKGLLEKIKQKLTHDS